MIKCYCVVLLYTAKLYLHEGLWQAQSLLKTDCCSAYGRENALLPFDTSFDAQQLVQPGTIQAMLSVAAALPLCREFYVQILLNILQAQDMRIT